MKGIMGAFMLSTVLALGSASAYTAEYDKGASDAEIKIGQTIAYSGPATVLGVMGRAQTAYFDMVNSKGGVNGRKVVLMSTDDAYNPPRTLENIRRLVEQDEVLAIAGSNGVATNLAVRDYLKAKGVPHLFIIGGTWNDPAKYPMTTGSTHSYITEGRVYARYVLKNKPDAKIAVLYQNDDYGKDTLKGLKEELGDKAGMIVAEASYDKAAPTIDSEVTSLAASKADVYIDMSYGKFTAQSIRRADALGWDPLHIVVYGASPAILQMPEADRHMAEGIMSATFYKNPADAAYDTDPGMMDYKKFVAEWGKDIDPKDALGINGYLAAALLHHTLEQAGDNLTRANLAKQATNINDLQLPLLLPGVSINVRPDNYLIFRSGRLQKFDGKSWSVLDEVVSLEN
jgi:ABC-type branched-subunit amino acid transport system substrate-binding protein